MGNDKVLAEAERLRKLDWAVHWLKPKSKIPKQSWGEGSKVLDLPALKAIYRTGDNLGVRLGGPSRLADGYFLCTIDCDVKSKDPKHKDEMLKKLKGILIERGVKDGPTVLSGRGNGSCHIYMKSKSPFPQERLGAAKDLVEVKGLKKLCPAWDIVAYSAGRQMVLPPSLHPETGKPYVWEQAFTSVAALPVWRPLKGNDAASKNPAKCCEVEDLVDLDALPLKTQDAIRNGDLSENRSATAHGVECQMIKSGYSDAQIASVLTDPEYGLSAMAYDHVKSKNRAKAMAWLLKYDIPNAHKQLTAKNSFSDEALESSDSEMKDLPEGDDKIIYLSDDWKDRIERTKGDKPHSSLKNVVLILENHFDPKIFVHDSFAMRESYGVNVPAWAGKKGSAITDADIARIKLWFGETYSFEPPKDTIHDAVAAISHRNTFNPVRDLIDALPPWDGVDRLNTWLTRNFQAKGHPEYLAQVFRKWFVALVGRVYSPGLKFDWLPIFEGDGGIGKSSFGYILVGEQFFHDGLPDFGDKDAAQNLQGIWCVEVGELASIKRDLEKAKAFVSRQVDKFRPSYGRRMVECPRHCVFFGTTNKTEYLVDDTGNRRFKPVEVKQLNFEALRRDRDQLLAEACFIYTMGLEDVISLNTMEGEAKSFEQNMHRKKMIKDDSFAMAELLKNFFENECKDVTFFNPFKFKNIDLFGVGTVGIPGSGPLSKWQWNERNRRLSAKALRMLGYDNRKSAGTMFWFKTHSREHK